MAYVSKIEYDGAFYDIQDAVAQEKADTATSAAESAVATAEAAETAATEANETAEEAKTIAQGVAGSYSLDELDTGASWVDGRHIYKKTYRIPSATLTSGTWVTVVSDVGIENFDMLVRSEVVRLQPGSSLPSMAAIAYATVSQSALRLESPISLGNNVAYYVTIYYVKTA